MGKGDVWMSRACRKLVAWICLFLKEWMPFIVWTITSTSMVSSGSWHWRYPYRKYHCGVRTQAIWKSIYIVLHSFLRAGSQCEPGNSLYMYDTRSVFSMNIINFILTQAFTRSPTVASSGVRENVHPTNKLECVGTFYSKYFFSFIILFILINVILFCLIILKVHC